MKATLTVLGSGTSMGVPTIGCTCRVCTSADPHDRRTRPSVMVEWGESRVVIDTTPDFREQALREKIRHVDAVIYTHAHADHILGLDDLRPLTFHRGGKLSLFAQPATAKVLRRMFAYIFEGDYKYGAIAEVDLQEFEGPLEVNGLRFTPIPVMHGDALIHGYRFGEAAYLTDFSTIPEESMAMLEGLDVLFLDALRHRPHATHSTVDNSVKLARQLKAKRTFFTHISHDLPHGETNQSLPESVRLSHDGLRLEFEI